MGFGVIILVICAIGFIECQLGFGHLCPSYSRPAGLPDVGCQWQFVADTNGCPSYKQICYGNHFNEEPIGVIDSICLLRPSPGDLSCHGTNLRFYYRRGEGCLRFKYSGCGGNENNFRDEQECLKKCSRGTSGRRRSFGITSSGINPVDRCHSNTCPVCNDCIINKQGQAKCVPKFDCCTGNERVVNCQSSPCTTRESECPSAANCLANYCGGCTAKYFDTLWNPITDCTTSNGQWTTDRRRRPNIKPFCPHTTYPSPPSGCWMDSQTDISGCPVYKTICPDDPNDPRCLLAKDEGFKTRQYSAALRFYYDQASKSCEQFYFNGPLPHHANNFGSRGECSKACIDRRRRSASVALSRAGYCPVYPVKCVGVRVGQCAIDADCSGHRKCCTTGSSSCTRECIIPSRVKPGVCPSRFPGRSDRCLYNCRSDEDCSGSEKCCNTSCGASCQLAILPRG